MGFNSVFIGLIHNFSTYCLSEGMLFSEGEVVLHVI
jgi:hypothetical protein